MTYKYDTANKRYVRLTPEEEANPPADTFIEKDNGLLVEARFRYEANKAELVAKIKPDIVLPKLLRILNDLVTQTRITQSTEAGAALTELVEAGSDITSLESSYQTIKQNITRGDAQIDLTSISRTNS